MRMLWVTLGLVGAAPAGAQAPCAVPPELAGFAAPVAAAPVAAGAVVAGAVVAGAGEPLVVGRAVRLVLAVDPALPVAPERAAKPGTYGAALAFTVTAAGRYQVALGGPAWVDVVRGGTRLASAAHGHGPACSGARKLVAYDLAPGRYMLQLSGSPAATATVMVAGR